MGTPLTVVISGANVHDSQVFELVIDTIPEVYNGRPGRPRFRPKKVHADKGYDYPSCRKMLKDRGIIPRIARRGIESSERLGKHRWVVERSHAWLKGFRRLRIRFERRDDIHLAFLYLGCALVCLNQIRRLC
jgi:transposase